MTADRALRPALQHVDRELEIDQPARPELHVALAGGAPKVDLHLEVAEGLHRGQGELSEVEIRYRRDGDERVIRTTEPTRVLGNFRRLESPLHLRGIDTVVLDKTGTVTEGTPAVVSVMSLGSIGKEEVLAHAAALRRDHERRDEHNRRHGDRGRCAALPPRPLLLRARRDPSGHQHRRTKQPPRAKIVEPGRVIIARIEPFVSVGPAAPVP